MILGHWFVFSLISGLFVSQSVVWHLSLGQSLLESKNLAKPSRIFDFFTIVLQFPWYLQWFLGQIVKKTKILEVLQGFWIPADCGPKKGVV